MNVDKDVGGINLDKILTGKIYHVLQRTLNLKEYDMCRSGVCPYANEKVCEEALEDDVERLQALLDESIDIKLQDLSSKKIELEWAMQAARTNEALQLIKKINMI